MNSTISAWNAHGMQVYFYMSKGLSCVVEEVLVSGNNTAGMMAWLCTTAEMTAPEPIIYLQVCSLVTAMVKNKTDIILQRFAHHRRIW